MLSRFIHGHGLLTEVVKDRPEGGRFDKVEETEDDLNISADQLSSFILVSRKTAVPHPRGIRAHPVSQPLLVVVLIRRLQSLDAQVSGDGPSDQVGQGRSQAEQVEKDQKDESASEPEDTVDLGDLGLGFSLVEDGVLGELNGHARWG